ncbi:MAG: hypothetical protein U9R58_12215, partial [Chloroflexota bacterium]|nr:hypothetical protein [Chloroflexota bacterium]
MSRRNYSLIFDRPLVYARFLQLNFFHAALVRFADEFWAHDDIFNHFCNSVETMSALYFGSMRTLNRYSIACT